MFVAHQNIALAHFPGVEHTIEDHCQIQVWEMGNILKQFLISLTADETHDNPFFGFAVICKEGNIEVFVGKIAPVCG